MLIVFGGNVDIISFLKANAPREDVTLKWRGEPIGSCPVTNFGIFLWDEEKGCHVETDDRALTEMLGSHQEGFNYFRILRRLELATV